MATNKGGGNASHRPDCTCFACERKKEAIARAAREQQSRLLVPENEIKAKGPGSPINADILEVEVPGTSCRSRVGQWIVLRQQEPSITYAEAAKKMGISASTLKTHVQKAVKEGWLTFSDPLSRIEQEIIPQTLDNIAFYLSKEGGRDKQITLETAKATIYRQYLDAQGISDAPQTILALKIEPVETGNGEVPKVSGHIVGVPRLSLPIITVEKDIKDESR